MNVLSRNNKTSEIYAFQSTDNKQNDFLINLMKLDAMAIFLFKKRIFLFIFAVAAIVNRSFVALFCCTAEKRDYGIEKFRLISSSNRTAEIFKSVDTKCKNP